ncbi:MAG: S1/P1 nuclease [Pyrinomonadaceae bacterium]
MTKFGTKVLVLTIFTLGLVFPARAWDEVGHKITAYIAWQQMTPATRDRVIQILLAAPEDAQLSTFYASYGSRTLESRQREFFMLAATWPDIIRDKKFNNRYTKYAHSNWHYADTFWTWKDGKVEPVADEEPSGLAMQKLEDFNQVIRSSSASDADKAIAISWLAHLIGDMHQPLHASSRVTPSNPKGDQGGNLFLLTPKGTPRENQENLHWFWDSIVIRYLPNSKDQCDADFLNPIAQDIIKLYPYDKLKGRINPDKFDVWKTESYDISSTEVYKGVNWFEMPSDDYKKKAFGIAQERLALAGYRMGDLFNEVFGSPAQTNATSPTK